MAASSNSTAKLFWKTTTHVRTDAPPERRVDHPVIASIRSPWLIYDAWGLTQGLNASEHLTSISFADDFHFQPFVYQAMNEALLHAACVDL